MVDFNAVDGSYSIRIRQFEHFLLKSQLRRSLAGAVYAYLIHNDLAVEVQKRQHYDGSK
jgi:hypothetical protein